MAHAYPEALNAQDRACECYKECKSLFHAAKMLEQSVLICKDSQQFDKITSFAERGALLYRHVHAYVYVYVYAYSFSLD